MRRPRLRRLQGIPVPRQAGAGIWLCRYPQPELPAREKGEVTAETEAAARFIDRELPKLEKLARETVAHGTNAPRLKVRHACGAAPTISRICSRATTPGSHSACCRSPASPTTRARCLPPSAASIRCLKQEPARGKGYSSRRLVQGNRTAYRLQQLHGIVADTILEDHLH